jgi:hypothetical protein
LRCSSGETMSCLTSTVLVVILIFRRTYVVLPEKGKGNTKTKSRELLQTPKFSSWLQEP